MQVIIFTNDNGGVSVCVPTGELDIQAVKSKDTPSTSIIVQDSELPQADNDFFDAWELTNGTVSVNLTKAKALMMLLWLKPLLVLLCWQYSVAFFKPAKIGLVVGVVGVKWDNCSIR